LEPVQIADIPVMVKCSFCQLHDTDARYNECEFDPGGYFIVNGSEKVIIGQEHMVINKPIVFSRKADVKYDLTAQIRSQPKACGRLSQPLDIHLLAPTSKSTQRCIHAKMSKMEKTVPLLVLFRALNVVSDEEILSLICYDNDDNEFLDVFRPSIEESSTIRDAQLALDFIGRRSSVAGVEREQRARKATKLLNQFVLPHLGETESDITRKTYFIGYMTHQLVMTALRRRDEDDRDHYCNKRLDLAGPLISGLFGQLFTKMRDDLRKEIVRTAKPDFSNMEIRKLVKIPSSITKGLEYSIATGNWNSNCQAAGSKVGVSQALNRLTFLSTLSNLRRTNTPIGRDAKLTRPRHLHNTHWGYICPVETPEGHACGLIKNLALMTLITVDRGEDQIQRITGALDDVGVRRIEEISPAHIREATKIFVNGRSGPDSWFSQPPEFRRPLVYRQQIAPIAWRLYGHSITDQGHTSLP
jgi:DNA-directed RNA polymerase II subunit RPB2